MAMFEIYPWARFLAGMLTGCWIGAAIATAGVILLMGRRVRQLESINILLRAKLKARAKARSAGTGTGGGGGHMLVMPLPDTHRQSEKPANRVARMN
jgi:hypothetical protein